MYVKFEFNFPGEDKLAFVTISGPVDDMNIVVTTWQMAPFLGVMVKGGEEEEYLHLNRN